MNKKIFHQTASRRKFIQLMGLGIGAGFLGLSQVACKGGQKATQPVIQGFEITAVSDLFPDRCAKLAERTGCKKA